MKTVCARVSGARLRAGSAWSGAMRTTARRPLQAGSVYVSRGDADTVVSRDGPSRCDSAGTRAAADGLSPTPRRRKRLRPYQDIVPQLRGPDRSSRHSIRDDIAPCGNRRSSPLGATVAKAS
jgi:hypothetical protein